MRLGMKFTFNQTRMELKLRSVVYNEGSGDAFNQTRMELKHIREIRQNDQGRLLIRPEWN